MRDVLKVETFRTSVGENALVGSYALLSNHGCMVAPKTTKADMEELSTLLQLPVVAGTVNRGNPQVGCGVISNDWTAFVGLDTTASEMSVLERVLKLERKRGERVRKGGLGVGQGATHREDEKAGEGVKKGSGEGLLEGGLQEAIIDLHS